VLWFFPTYLPFLSGISSCRKSAALIGFSDKINQFNKGV